MAAVESQAEAPQVCVPGSTISAEVFMERCAELSELLLPLPETAEAVAKLFEDAGESALAAQAQTVLSAAWESFPEDPEERCDQASSTLLDEGGPLRSLDAERFSKLLKNGAIKTVTNPYSWTPDLDRSPLNYLMQCGVLSKQTKQIPEGTTASDTLQAAVRASPIQLHVMEIIARVCPAGTDEFVECKWHQIGGSNLHPKVLCLPAALCVDPANKIRPTAHAAFFLDAAISAMVPGEKSSVTIESPNQGLLAQYEANGKPLFPMDETTESFECELISANMLSEWDDSIHAREKFILDCAAQAHGAANKLVTDREKKPYNQKYRPMFRQCGLALFHHVAVLASSTRTSIDWTNPNSSTEWPACASETRAETMMKALNNLLLMLRKFGNEAVKATAAAGEADTQPQWWDASDWDCATQLSKKHMFVREVSLYAQQAAQTLRDVIDSRNQRALTAEKAAQKKAARTNRAFVFIKPHAVTDAVKGLISKELPGKNIKILSEGSITSEEIDEKKLIDQHYYAIASKATILKPSELNVPADKFEEKFGESWTAALEADKVYNAMDGCDKLEIDAVEMDKHWGLCKEAGKLIKFGGGFYCGLIEIEGKEPIYVFNGFFMSMRSKFTAPGLSIYYYLVEFDANELSWENFRGQVLGPTDPAEAPPGSLRGLVMKDWESLGLEAEPNVGDNGVHASASPFEGLAERLNWVGAKLEDDEFGKAMLDAGITEKWITAGCVDPQVTLDADGNKGSLFDAVEDMDSQACLTKLTELFLLDSDEGGAAAEVGSPQQQQSSTTGAKIKTTKKQAEIMFKAELLFLDYTIKAQEAHPLDLETPEGIATWQKQMKKLVRWKEAKIELTEDLANSYEYVAQEIKKLEEESKRQKEARKKEQKERDLILRENIFNKKPKKKKKSQVQSTGTEQPNQTPGDNYNGGEDWPSWKYLAAGVGVATAAAGMWAWWSRSSKLRK